VFPYASDAIDGTHYDPDDAAQDAHWSLLEGWDTTGRQLRLANPDGGKYDWVSLENLVSANLQLKGGCFNWPSFIESCRGDEVLEPILREQAPKYKTTLAELQKLGKERVFLDGYFVAIYV
jgi:hypothetical protein